MDYTSQIVDVIEYQQAEGIQPLAVKVDDHFIRIIEIKSIIHGLTSKSHDFGYCYDVLLEDHTLLRLFYRLSDQHWFIEKPLN